MAKYLLYFTETRKYDHYVVVEAEDDAEAEDIGRQLEASDSFKYDRAGFGSYCDMDFEFDFAHDASDDMDVEDVDEYLDE